MLGQDRDRDRAACWRRDQTETEHLVYRDETEQQVPKSRFARFGLKCSGNLGSLAFVRLICALQFYFDSGMFHNSCSSRWRGAYPWFGSLVANKLKFRTSLGSGNYVRDSSSVRKLFANNVCNVYVVQICDAELS